MNGASRGFIGVALGLLVGVMLLHLAALSGIGTAWSAMVTLALLGWASGMIFAISYHVMPVFLARDFPPHTPLVGHLGIFSIASVWLPIALLLNHAPATAIGYSLFGGCGIWFVYNLMRLLRDGSPRGGGPPPLPFPEQREVDRAAIQATRYAPLGLVGAPFLLAAVDARWLPGSWHLAGEHWLVLGWLMPMIMGVAYHILPRFSQIPVRSARGAQLQLTLHLVAVPCVVIGLGASIPLLFTLGASLGGISLLLFAWLISPTLTVYRPAVLALHHIPIREATP